MKLFTRILFALPMAFSHLPPTRNITGDVREFIQSLGISTALGADIAARFQQQTKPAEGNINFACQITRLVFDSSYSDPITNSRTYTTLADINWSLSCRLRPSCILAPRSAPEVSTAIKIISFLEIPFSVRGGGHSANPGWANTDSGILISLSELTEVSLNADKTVASIGSGNRWGAVYETLARDGVGVVGGRIHSVGVAGLILGGGVFYFTNGYGLACDNVKNFQVVLSSGDIVNANVDENSDLFWGLKGGSVNFGIVTRFDLVTFPEFASFRYEVLSYSSTQNEKLLEALEEYQRIGELDTKSGVMQILHGNTSLTALTYIGGNVDEQPAAFKSFYEVPATSPLVGPTVGGLDGLTQAFAPLFSGPAERHTIGSMATSVDITLYKSLYASYESVRAEIAQRANATASFFMHTLSKSAVEYGSHKGGNAMGLSDEPQQWICYSLDWANPADDEYIFAKGRQLQKEWRKLAKAKGLYLPLEYVNDASHDQDPMRSYGRTNYAKLKAVSRIYDPGQVFQRLSNGGFLLRGTDEEEWVSTNWRGVSGVVMEYHLKFGF